MRGMSAPLHAEHMHGLFVRIELHVVPLPSPHVAGAVEQPGQPTRGLLHSAALTSVERLHLDAARQRLVVEIDLTDPEFFMQPFPRSRTEYAPSALKIEPFNCSPEGLTGTIKRNP